MGGLLFGLFFVRQGRTPQKRGSSVLLFIFVTPWSGFIACAKVEYEGRCGVRALDDS